jgi:RNA recognition motif-containing protein
MNIYVGNLNPLALDTDIKRLFSEYGIVRSVKLVMDEYSQRSKGFAFVDMADKKAGELAIRKLHQLFFMQKSIIVKDAGLKESARTW